MAGLRTHQFADLSVALPEVHYHHVGKRIWQPTNALGFTPLVTTPELFEQLFWIAYRQLGAPAPIQILTSSPREWTGRLKIDFDWQGNVLLTVASRLEHHLKSGREVRSERAPKLVPLEDHKGAREWILAPFVLPREIMESLARPPKGKSA